MTPKEPMNIHEQYAEKRQEARRVADELEQLSEIDDPTPGQSERTERLLKAATRIETEEAALRTEVLKEIERLAQNPANLEPVGSFTAIRGGGDPYESFTRSRPDEWEELAKRAVGEDTMLTAEQKEAVEAKRETVCLGRTADDEAPSLVDAKQLFDRHILRSNSPEYQRAWTKKVFGQGEYLTAEEADALRSVNIGSGAAGSFLTPAAFDPTVILQNNGTYNPFRQISRIIPIVGANTWNGISSDGMAVTYVGELVANTDNAFTVAQPSISAKKVSSFVPVSIEAFEDITQVQSIVTEMLIDAKDRFEQGEFGAGVGGANAIRGIITALNGSSAQLYHATNSVFTSNDVFAVVDALPARFAQNATWVSAPAYANRIRRLGSQNISMETVNLTADRVRVLNGDPLYYASSFTNGLNTLTNHAFVYGDFSRYAIVERVGLSVEPIPHLFSGTNTASGVAPTVGARGIYAHWRVGGDVLTTNAFILSSNPGA